jgi:hypothetical protein
LWFNKEPFRKGFLAAPQVKKHKVSRNDVGTFPTHSKKSNYVALGMKLEHPFVNSQQNIF